jgi:hypothetical protein
MDGVAPRPPRDEEEGKAAAEPAGSAQDEVGAASSGQDESRHRAAMAEEEARAKAAWAHAAEQEAKAQQERLESIERFTLALRKAAYGDGTVEGDKCFLTVESMLRMRKITDVDVHDRNGFRGIHWAAGRGHVRLLLLMLHYKADVNQPTQTDLKWSPLHFAVFYSQLEAINILVDNGAELQKCGDSGPHPNMSPKEINQLKLDTWTVDQGSKLASRQTRSRVRRRSSVKGGESKNGRERPRTPEPPYSEIAQILDSVLDMDESG